MISLPTSPVYRRRLLVATLIAVPAACALLFAWHRWHSAPATSQQQMPPGTADTPTPDLLALERLLSRELPLRLDATKVYPSRQRLPGAPFRPLPFDFARQPLTAALPPGDYSLPVVAFNLTYCDLWPGAFMAYQLGPMQGKAAETLSTLLWRGVAPSGLAPTTLQLAACAIVSGIPFGQMPGLDQQSIERFVPELKEPLNSDFLEGVLKLYGAHTDLSSVSEDLRKALMASGPLGRTAMQAVIERNLLLRQGLGIQQRSRMIADGGSNDIATPTKPEDAPWAEVIPEVAFMRLRLFSGSLVQGMLELRIVPPSKALAASGAGPREPPTLMSLFGAKVAPDGTVRVTGLVGYPLAPQAWPVTIFPFAPR